MGRTIQTYVMQPMDMISVNVNKAYCGNDAALGY